MKTLVRWLPIIILVVLLIVVISMGWYRYLSFSSLSQYHQQLQNWTDHHYVLMIPIYMLIYIIAVAISIPGATLLTLLGGLLFGVVAGSILVIVSATIGACLIFFAVKSSFGAWLQRKAHGWVQKMEQGFQRNAFNYLLFLRFVPLFPFWVVNIVPALLNVRLRVFFIATLIGIIPGSIVYVAVGNGLGSLLSHGREPNLGIIFQTEFLIPLLCLALLSLVPIIYKKIRKSHD